MRRTALALGLGILVAAGAARGVDSDGDGIENAFDNCLLVSNPDQLDGDQNGCGDACTRPITCDTDGNLAVGAEDQGTIGMNWGMAVPPGTRGDCDGNGVVGAPDVAAFAKEMGNVVGPSGLGIDACDPSTCICNLL